MTAFDRAVVRSWEENLLFSVLVELTYRCNLDCFYCYNDVNLKGRPLTKEQYFSFFEDLARMQVMSLVLSGGEPLAHPDFMALGRRARELGFMVRVKTNGHAFGGALARKVRDEVDPWEVEISLHGATAEVHDRQTRVGGSFARLMKNLPELRELGYRVKLNSTLTAWNEAELDAMHDLADSIGFPLRMETEVTPRDDGDREPLSIKPSRESVLRLFRLRQERSRIAVTASAAGGAARGEETTTAGDDKPPSRNCGAGSSGIAIDPYGNVYPCVQWRRPVGNLHEKPISQIWASNGALDEIRGLTTEARTMVESHGVQGRLMAFCPGLAEIHTGNPVAAYPAAIERMKIAQEVRAEAPPAPERPMSALLVPST